MTRISLLSGIALTLGLSAPAFAGGFAEPIATPPVAAPVIVQAPVVTSADWTGFYAGAQLGYGQLKSDGIEDADGLVYGVHAGYLYDLGNIVLGGELDYDMTEIGFTAPAVDLDSVARLKLRVGYDAGAFQPYLVAGAAQADVSGALDGTSDGAFAGLGVDYNLSDSFRVGGEVLAHQFDDLVDSGVDVEATTLTLRASYAF
jgi:outer membrane immunogenic protein